MEQMELLDAARDLFLRGVRRHTSSPQDPVEGAHLMCRLIAEQHVVITLLRIVGESGPATAALLLRAAVGGHSYDLLAAALLVDG